MRNIKAINREMFYFIILTFRHPEVYYFFEKDI